MKTIAGLVDDCAVALQKIVRLKAALASGSQEISCVTCGKRDHWKRMHGGHFIARSYRQHKLLEENIHPQCPGCNTFKPERVADDYNLYMRETYGDEFVNELTRTKREPMKYYRADLMDLLKSLRKQARELEKSVEGLNG